MIILQNRIESQNLLLESVQEGRVREGNFSLVEEQNTVEVIFDIAHGIVHIFEGNPHIFLLVHLLEILVEEFVERSVNLLQILHDEFVSGLHALDDV